MATGETLAERVVEDADHASALRQIAAEYPGPVIVALPGSLFATRTVSDRPLARITGRRPLARALDAPLSAIAVASSRAGRGRIRLVASRRAVLAATADYLRAQGLDPAVMEPDDGTAPGAFPARRFGRGTGPSALLRIDRLPVLPLPSRRIGAAAAAACAVAAVVWATLEPPTVLDAALAPPVLVEAAPTFDPVADAATVSAPIVDAAGPRMAPPRPRALPPAVLLTAAPPEPRQPEPSPPSVAEREGPVVLSVATRSVPPEVREAARAGAEAAVRLATLAPLPRPREASEPAVAEPAAAEPAVAAPPLAAGAGLRPLPRSGPVAAAPVASAATAPSAATATTAAGTEGRPLARPQSDADRVAAAVATAVAAAPMAAVEVASLDPAAGAAAGALRPAPRRAAPPPSTARSAPAPAAARQPARASAAPPPAPPRAVAPAAAVPVQVARLQPQPVAAPPQPVRAQPQVVRAQPQAAPVSVQPARAQPVPAQPQQVARAQPQAAAPAAASGGSGGVALIGVFGTASQRHALLRLPNGSVQRVRPGQTVSGVQVAAVGADNVRVRVNGRDSVLRLPD